MNENCCGICNKTVGTSCEDLRVDCLALVKRRYCIVSPKFSREFCSRSCGFCPPTDNDIIDKTDHSTILPTLGYL